MSTAPPGSSEDTATCCIVGGGPAGVMLGFLLARHGVDVLVLEKHRDFFRDFRGDTIHPSTLEVLHELGLLAEFLRQPHQEVRGIQVHFARRSVHIADFSHLPVRCPFVAFVPQWDFLNFLCAHARKFPGFRLRLETEATGLLEKSGRITGVRAKTPAGFLEIRAPLVIGADGRGSIVRAAAGLEIVDLGAPIDVLWFRVSKKIDDPAQAFGFIDAGQFMVLIDRGDYWQCAYVIPKDGFEAKRARGLDSFRDDVARCATFLAGRTAEIRNWDEVKLLSVKVDRLRQWHRPGLLCLGDAAHAMSPVGGVGINLAIQDAVAAARMLGPKLRAGPVDEDDLAAVQARREGPTRSTQRLQVFLHRHLLEPIFASPEVIPPPLVLRLTERFPRLRRIPARLIGMGFGPEHLDHD
ncbi:MAG TPA: FAD-dependent oxidoreductase [Candidatus Didemnitutus sp.]